MDRQKNGGSNVVVYLQSHAYECIRPNFDCILSFCSPHPSFHPYLQRHGAADVVVSILWPNSSHTMVKQQPNNSGENFIECKWFNLSQIIVVK